MRWWRIDHVLLDAGRQCYDLIAGHGRSLLSGSTDPASNGCGSVSSATRVSAEQTHGYTDALRSLLVRFDDNRCRYAGGGLVEFYAIEWIRLPCRRDKQQIVGRSWSHYDNEFDPTLDVWLRLIRRYIVRRRKRSVTLGTVVRGVAIGHDDARCDFTQSIKHG